MTTRAVPIDVLTPMRGLIYDAPGTVMPKEGATGGQNLRLLQGVIQPAPGYSNFGSQNTVLGTPQLITEYVENDGDRHLLAFTTKYIYEYNTALDNWATIASRQAVLSSCDSVWTASANVTAATEGTIKLVGTNSAKLTIAAGFTTGLAAYVNFTGVDTTTYNYVHFWIRSSINTLAGDLRLAIDDTNACASPLTYYDVPALTANVWTQVEVAIGSGSNAAVLSVGLDVVTDNGAQIVYIDNVLAVDRFTGATTNRWSVDTYLDKFYATNGVDPIQVKDHSNAFDDWAEAVSSGYKCKTLAKFANHLVMGNMIESGTDYPQRIRWTDSADVVFTGTAGSTETDGEDGIQRLKVLGTRLACYKERSIVMITHIGGSTVYRFDRPITDKGILGMDYVCDYGELHIFTSSENIYLYGGGADATPIGDHIADEFFRILTNSSGEHGFMFYNKDADEVYLFEPTDAVEIPNIIWVFNVGLACWFKRAKTGLNAIGAYKSNATTTFGDAVGTFGAATTTFGDRGLTSGAPTVLLGLSDGTIVEMDYSTVDDVGAAILKRFETADFTADRLPVAEDNPVAYVDNTKRWLRLAYEAYGTALTGYYSTNEGASWNFIKTQSLGATYRKYFFSIDVPAEKIRFRFENNDVAGHFYLRWYSPSVIGGSEV